MSSARRPFILHIDDDEDDRIMLKEAVKAAGSFLEVWPATTGTEGLEILQQCNLINQLPLLIVLDLNLPGMDGKIVLREIKKEKSLSTISLVLLTTSSGEMDKMFATKEGVQLFTKPSCEAEFFDVVKNIIELSNGVKER
jgi:CheY-like chemotaxis protein